MRRSRPPSTIASTGYGNLGPRLPTCTAPLAPGQAPPVLAVPRCERDRLSDSGIRRTRDVLAPRGWRGARCAGNTAVRSVVPARRAAIAVERTGPSLRVKMMSEFCGMLLAMCLAPAILSQSGRGGLLVFRVGALSLFVVIGVVDYATRRRRSAVERSLLKRVSRSRRARCEARRQIGGAYSPGVLQ